MRNNIKSCYQDRYTTNEFVYEASQYVDKNNFLF